MAAEALAALAALAALGPPPARARSMGSRVRPEEPAQSLEPTPRMALRAAARAAVRAGVGRPGPAAATAKTIATRARVKDQESRAIIGPEYYTFFTCQDILLNYLSHCRLQVCAIDGISVYVFQQKNVYCVHIWVNTFHTVTSLAPVKKGTKVLTLGAGR